MPGLSLFLHPVGRLPGRKLLPLIAAGLFLACDASGSQTPRGGRAASSLQEAPQAPQERLPPRGEAWVIFETDTVLAEVARTAGEREEEGKKRQSHESSHGTHSGRQSGRVKCALPEWLPAWPPDGLFVKGSTRS